MSAPDDTNNGFAPEFGLTPIHQRIHCAATPDNTGDVDELDIIAVDNFLDTLAEVAVAIARRKEHLEL